MAQRPRSCRTKSPAGPEALGVPPLDAVPPHAVEIENKNTENQNRTDIFSSHRRGGGGGGGADGRQEAKPAESAASKLHDQLLSGRDYGSWRSSFRYCLATFRRNAQGSWVDRIWLGVTAEPVRATPPFEAARQAAACPEFSDLVVNAAWPDGLKHFVPDPGPEC